MDIENEQEAHAKILKVLPEGAVIHDLSEGTYIEFSAGGKYHMVSESDNEYGYFFERYESEDAFNRGTSNGGGLCTGSFIDAIEWVQVVDYN